MSVTHHSNVSSACDSSTAEITCIFVWHHRSIPPAGWVHPSGWSRRRSFQVRDLSEVTFAVCWRDMGRPPTVSAISHPSLWAAALPSVMWEGTVSKVLPWVSDTIWRLLGPGEGHGEWLEWRSPTFCIFSSGLACVSLGAPHTSPPLHWDAWVEVRGGRPQCSPSVPGGQPIWEWVCSSSYFSGPQKSILQTSHPVSDRSSPDWVSRRSRHSGYCMVWFRVSLSVTSSP